ncbi:MAG: hypothetical protein DF280_02395 ['Brassica napus' phytoplasma]|nr:MAG: hypothetical protein DF280_02395 ['Brassica napus' phytoplasma]
MKKYRIEIIKNHSSENDNNLTLTNPITPQNTKIIPLKHISLSSKLIILTNKKDYIKELISKITIDKLETLKLYKLDAKKVDKYNNPIKNKL